MPEQGSTVIRISSSNLKSLYELRMPRKTSKSKPNAYHAHRGRQRRRILGAAERLFERRGIDRTTMADVISASELRPSTMYQYFSNKDDIVWAILGEVLEESAARAKNIVEGATSGLAKITALLQYMADELAKNQARIRFLAQFDAMYARDWPVERLLTLESQIHDEGFKAFRKLIREGIADGSLRPDLHPDLTLHAVMNAVVAAQRRLASLGKKVELEYGQPIDRLFGETIRIIVLGLRAPEHSNTTKPAPRAKARTGTTRKRSS
jgi:TetR/AcrR family transcriptional regulator, cholesterol catabolism regulator